MAHHGVKHDYHIINPSPWPLMGSVSGVFWALGLVMGLRGLFGQPKGTWWLEAVGVAGILLTMLFWWRDVIKESKAGDHTPVVQIGLRYGMIMFICSEVMFFAAFFWMFFQMALFSHFRAGDMSSIDEVRAAWSTWPPKGVETLDPWQLPLVNTLLLLTSGTTVTWAHHALAEGDRKGAKWGLVLTVILGALFTCVQGVEYTHILTHHEFFNDESTAATLYGSTFFLATGFHGFHVLIGTIFLIVCLLRLLGGDFTPKKHFGFEAAAWYWHFVDVVWLFLFAFIYVIFGGTHG